jgi:hypothetical protein
MVLWKAQGADTREWGRKGERELVDLEAELKCMRERGVESCIV